MRRLPPDHCHHQQQQIKHRGGVCHIAASGLSVAGCVCNHVVGAAAWDAMQGCVWQGIEEGVRRVRDGAEHSEVGVKG